MIDKTESRDVLITKYFYGLRESTKYENNPVL